MALYYELPVYRDTYKLILLIFQYTKDFSREYKYTLGQDMKRDAMVLVRGIYRANKSKEKQEYLETLLDDFELLKLEIRLIFIIFLIGHYAQGIFSNIIMIVLAIVFILLMILIYALADAGWGKPYGNDLLIGYTFTFIGSSLIVLESIIYSFRKNKTVL